MTKEDNLQLELFSQDLEPGPVKTRLLPNSFLRYLRTYEKTILLVVGFIIISILSFILGVKKGKGIVEPTVYLIEKKEPALKTEGQIEKNEYPNNYTIQVASYKDKLAANKEVEVLKKKGFSSLALAKGKYIVVCVGNFPNQKIASGLLAQLKKRYRDCILRRL